MIGLPVIPWSILPPTFHWMSSTRIFSGTSWKLGERSCGESIPWPNIGGGYRLERCLMTKDEKFKLKWRSQCRLFWGKIFGGDNCPVKLSLFVSYLLGAVWVWSKQKKMITFAGSIELISPIFQTLLTHSISAYQVVGNVLLVGFAVYPFSRKQLKINCKVLVWSTMPG